MNLIKLKLYEILRKCAAKNRSFPMWNIKWSQFRFKRLSARRNFCEMRNQTRIFFILVTQDATCTSKRRRQYQLEFPLKKWQTKAIHFFFSLANLLQFGTILEQNYLSLVSQITIGIWPVRVFHLLLNYTISSTTCITFRKMFQWITKSLIIFTIIFFHARYMLPAIFSRTITMDQNAFNLKENSSFHLLCVWWFLGRKSLYIVSTRFRKLTN